MSRLRQMGRGSSSILQVQMSAVVVTELKKSYSISSSKQKTCEKEKTIMRNQYIKTDKTGVKPISITATLKATLNVKLGALIVAAMLVFGYGDGFSSSALVYSQV